jgi:2-methylfumaryl-CoA hydratase
LSVPSKTGAGRFFEDFRLDEEIVHATPRTLTTGDAAVYGALFGARFAVPASDPFARSIGFPRAPLDELLVFHVVFGKSVPDVSLNAVANLGYAEGRFGAPVYPGDTISARSTVIGLKENSSRETGVVYVRTTGRNQHREVVLDYVRWVMVNKRDKQAKVAAERVPELADAVTADKLLIPAELDCRRYQDGLAGSPYRWGDYTVGERIDHVDGITVEEAEHMMATRLYHNTARVHFNAFAARQGRFGRRLIYGGHVISLARTLSFNGLANAFRLAAINAGRHVNPLFAGDTVFAWSAVLEKAAVQGREDVGALRLRTVATKDRPCADFPDKGADGMPDPAVLLDFDYWALIPR